MADQNGCRTDYKKLQVSRLDPGQMGVLLARAGAGKTAVLTHIALGYMLEKEPVLHVCVDGVPDKVKVWYDEVLKDIFSTAPQCSVSDLQHSIEPLRFIMSFLNQTFSPEKVEMGIDNLRSQAKFDPALIILDGLDFGRERGLFEKIGELARRQSTPVWVSARSHRHIPDVNERGIPYPIDAMDDLFSSIFILQHEETGMRLRALKEKGCYNPSCADFIIDPITFLPPK
ncbi:MAG: hypothetical protein M1398_01455 [Deltaproteobacteria bacterium]|nr:hypothetical protein [Deltaproteobacteria bacterium]MDA8308345.1 hypothetical protein [Deltaproteobacteria bacterium]